MANAAVRILIVDDEPPIRKLLRVGLSAQGHAIVEAMNAKVATELVKSERPDLVVLDLGLPDMTSSPNGVARGTISRSSFFQAATTRPAS